MNPSDLELVSAAQQGSDQAFAQLYKRHAAGVSGGLWRTLGREQDVEDVMQVTFLEVHRCLGRYDSRWAFSTWVNHIAFRMAGRHLRAKKRRWWWSSDHTALSQAADEKAGADMQAQGGALVRGVFTAMQQLPDKQRIAFTLHDLEEMGLTEIGKIVDASPQTVRARVHAARRKVAEYLRAAGLAEENPS